MRRLTRKLCESVLDFPREDLDKSVWQKDENNEYVLTPEAESKVSRVIDFLTKSCNIQNCSVNMTGSITSNSYSDDSDIDLHFNSPLVKKSDSEEMNKKLRDAFDAEFKQAVSPEDIQIGGHPIEVYFQANPFQDLMSVGCYSITYKKWLVGPEFTRRDFNPFEEYFDDDMKYVNHLMGDIRNLVLETYEKALVAAKSPKWQKRNDIDALLSKAAKLFDSVRKTRKHMSEPKSEEDAKKMRSDKKWKIADSAFKLLDKFGYLAILREFATLSEDTDLDVNAKADAIVDVVRKNLGPENKKLHELEEKDDESQKISIWIDDVRQVPPGYLWLKSTNDFISFVEQNGTDVIKVIDIDHDAGDFQNEGGDYIKCLDYLDFISAKDINIKLHSANPVGIQNMRRIILKNEKNGWREVDGTFNEDEQIDEGAKEAFAAFALACAASFPGVLQGKTLNYAKNMSKGTQEFREKQQYFMDALKFVDPEQKINQFTIAQNANILACTYYGEGRGEIALDAFDPIVDTTLNRANQDPSKVALVCIARANPKSAFQYSFWNKNKEALQKIKAGQVVVPQKIKTDILERKAWDFCVKRAIDVLLGNYTSQNEDINSYYVANMKNPPSWASQMTDDFIAGHHRFGYVKTNDPMYVDMTTLKPLRTIAKNTTKQPANIYTVKKGDTLWKIAKDNGVSQDYLIAKNHISNPKALRIGQKIVIG